jgi:hypothetical protein
MRIGADARGAEADRPRRGLRRRDQIGQAAEAAIGADEDTAHVIHQIGDRRDLLHRIGGPPLQRDGDQVRQGDDADRVAIRDGTGDGGKADLAAGAGAVDDHEGLPEPGFDPAPKGAGGDIGATARAEGHQHGDRLFRPGSGGRAGHGDEYRQNQRQQPAHPPLPQAGCVAAESPKTPNPATRQLLEQDA